MWETTMNPATRYLKQIEIEDAMLASKTTDVLMGNNAETRRDFIQKNATYANLDL